MLGTVKRGLYPRAIIEPVQEINMGIVTVFFIIIVSITGLKYKFEQMKFVATFKYYHDSIVIIIIKLLLLLIIIS